MASHKKQMNERDQRNISVISWEEVSDVYESVLLNYETFAGK